MTAKAHGVADVRITVYKAGVTSTSVAIIHYIMGKYKMGYSTDYELTINRKPVDLKNTKAAADIVSFMHRTGRDFDEYNAARMLAELAEHFKDFAGASDEEIMYRLEEISEYEWEGETTLNGFTWYDHDKHMKQLSKEFPEIEFLLDGVGEENGDVWKKTYKNGQRLKHQKAIISFEDAD